MKFPINNYESNGSNTSKFKKQSEQNDIKSEIYWLRATTKDQKISEKIDRKLPLLKNFKQYGKDVKVVSGNYGPLINCRDPKSVLKMLTYPHEFKKNRFELSLINNNKKCQKIMNKALKMVKRTVKITHLSPDISIKDLLTHISHKYGRIRMYHLKQGHNLSILYLTFNKSASYAELLKEKYPCFRNYCMKVHDLAQGRLTSLLVPSTLLPGCPTYVYTWDSPPSINLRDKETIIPIFQTSFLTHKRFKRVHKAGGIRRVLKPYILEEIENRHIIYSNILTFNQGLNSINGVI